MKERNYFQQIDKFTFFGALGLLLATTLPLILYPEQGAAWVSMARFFVTDNMGVLYLALGVGAAGFLVYVAFSDIGKISLGHPDEPPEFSTVSWSAMLFCAGIGASILYWSVIEWAYYYQSPPFYAEPGSLEAARWAAAYGIFHWGPLAWALFLIPALPMAYFYYVRKHRVLKISEALLPVLGERRAHGIIGKLFDVLFVFGMLGGGATSLALAAPLINEGLHELFGLPRNVGMQILVLMLITALFGASAFKGLKKGIQNLSKINLWLALVLLVFVFVTGPTVFMAETGLASIGTVLDNLIPMSTWSASFGGFEHFEDSRFPQDWTIFYWAWWLAFAPSVGLFIARISRGRTIRYMIIGTLFYGSLGCFLFFMVLGNFGLYLQLSGQLDVVQILNTETPTAAIFAVLGELPMRFFAIGVYTVLALIFTATTFDSISYILASVVQKKLDEEPLRWNRMFWAVALSFMPITLLILGGLDTLTTASIVAGAPLIVVALLLCIAMVRVARFDLRRQGGFEDDRILIDKFPGTDPWDVDGRD